MLVLTRRAGQYIMLGDKIKICVSEIQGGNVRMAIEAPSEVKIYRGEIYEEILQANKEAVVSKNLDIHLLLKHSK